jgi:hypothetical protein
MPRILHRPPEQVQRTEAGVMALDERPTSEWTRLSPRRPVPRPLDVPFHAPDVPFHAPDVPVHAPDVPSQHPIVPSRHGRNLGGRFGVLRDRPLKSVLAAFPPLWAPWKRQLSKFDLEPSPRPPERRQMGRKGRRYISA